MLIINRFQGQRIVIQESLILSVIQANHDSVALKMIITDKRLLRFHDDSYVTMENKKDLGFLVNMHKSIQPTIHPPNICIHDGFMAIDHTMKMGENVQIDNIQIVPLRFEHGQIKLGFHAPREITIHREEIYKQLQKEAVCSTSQTHH